MAGFLAGLGAAGAGAAPGISSIADTIQSNQSSSDFGNALASIYGGGTAQPQSSSGGISGILSALGGSLGGQQTSTAGAGAQPVPQASPMGTSTPGVGGVAAQGGGLGGGLGQPPAAQGQAQQNQQAQQPPQAPFQPPQQSAQPQARPQPQQQGQAGSGPLDLPTLVRNLVKQGVTGARLGNAVQRFVPLLNAQGLAQYRDLGLQLRSEQQYNLERQREFERNPKAQGSTAQNRVANQGIKQEGIDNIQKRFEAREKAALDKLKDAKTDKEAVRAKQDLDKIASSKKAELQQQLNIINSPGTDPEDQKEAAAKVKELNQQLQDATDEAIKARRNGGASDKASQAPGKKYVDKDGNEIRWNGKGDSSDIKNWEPVGGGQ